MCKVKGWSLVRGVRAIAVAAAVAVVVVVGHDRENGIEKEKEKGWEIFLMGDVFSSKD